MDRKGENFLTEGDEVPARCRGGQQVWHARLSYAADGRPHRLRVSELSDLSLKDKASWQITHQHRVCGLNASRVNGSLAVSRLVEVEDALVVQGDDARRPPARERLNPDA